MAEAPAPTPDNEQQPEPELADVVSDVVSTEPAQVATEPGPESVVAEGIAPEAGPTPEAAAAAVPLSKPEPAKVEDGPSVASTLEVPANPQAAAASNAPQEGGEWELLLQKLSTWISSGRLQEQWQAARTPLSLLVSLITLLLVLRVYTAVLNVLDSIPLIPGLLELAGLVAVVQFSITRLVRSQDRSEVIGGLKQRWQNFRGRG